MKPLTSSSVIFIAVLSFFFLACKTETEFIPAKSTITNPLQLFSINDTLSHYYNSCGNRTKLIIDSPASVIYIDSINTTQIAVVCFEDSVTEIFKYQSEYWQLMDSTTNVSSVWSIDETDLNGDGFKDLRLLYPVMRGNFVCQVLLYDSLKKKFYFNEHYNKINIGYDAKTGFVRSCGLGGVYDNSKEQYLIVGDSLAFYKGVNESISGTEKYGSYLSFYEDTNGLRKLVRSVKGTGVYINQLFENSLWDDDLDYFFVGTTKWNEP